MRFQRTNGRFLIHLSDGVDNSLCIEVLATGINIYVHANIFNVLNQKALFCRLSKNISLY